MRGKKAALLAPRFAKSFWSFEEGLKRFVPKNRFGLPKTTMPSLGLLGLGRHLQEHPQHYYKEVIFIDRNQDPRPLSELLEGVDHIFLGGMIAQEEAYLEDAREVKRLGKTLIAGGTIVDPTHPIAGIADYLVKNEAEMVIDTLLEDLFAGRPGKLYEGTQPPAENFFIPDYSLVPKLKDYISVPMQLTRGCPFTCEFCDIPWRFGSKARVTPSEHVERMLTQLHGLGFRGSIFIVDDNLISKPREILEQLRFLRGVEEKLGYRWRKYSEVSLNLVDDRPVMRELVEEIHKCGFTHLFVGVETDDEDALASVSKGQNLRGGLAEAVEELTRRTGAEVMAGMILGFDLDTEATAERQIRFINQLPVPIAMLSPLLALIHTKLYERLRLEGRLMAGATGNNSCGMTNFIPMNLSARRLEEKYLEVLEAINAPNAYFGRVMKSFDRVSLEGKGVPLGLKEKLYSAVTTLTSRHAWTFWKYLFKTDRLARRRAGFLTDEYQFLLGELFSHFVRYTHMRAETRRVRREVKHRSREPWQEVSWREIQNAEYRIENRPRRAESDAVPAGAGSTAAPLSVWNESIRVVLGQGFEIAGTRFDALSHFIEPHLRAGYSNLRRELKKLNRRRPNPEQLWQVVVDAFRRAHEQRPDILGSLSLSSLREAVRKKVGSPQQAYASLFQVYRTVNALE